jgi:transcriptional regulator with XRE-family HTH domain
MADEVAHVNLLLDDAELARALGTDTEALRRDRAVFDMIRQSATAIRAARESRGLTQKQLAARLGVTVGRVSQYESGDLRHAPSLRVLAEISHVLDMRAQVGLHRKEDLDAPQSLRDHDRIATFEVSARDTALGREEITRAVPGVSRKALRKLDPSGVVRAGTDVEPGDILVGRIGPRDASTITSEEKLLRAMFGEKPSDKRDISLRMPSGSFGRVVGVRVVHEQGEKEVGRVGPPGAPSTSPIESVEIVVAIERPVDLRDLLPPEAFVQADEAADADAQEASESAGQSSGAARAGD